jgi:hypothetical protein
LELFIGRGDLVVRFGCGCSVLHGGYRCNDDSDERWCGCCLTMLVGFLFRRVRLIFLLNFPCYEVGAAAPSGMWHGAVWSCRILSS